ncbi:hypothetical protein AMELA_G00201670 [Ameiurus melas]|uniref:Uncharacterized protein n=1 Tax=Ameiurus melas TaxID=219545 RepID=A0A7J6AAY4_AMEME|nr:hypothetical protein AMELA_G00201670 [Ameiurus melas]
MFANLAHYAAVAFGGALPTRAPVSHRGTSQYRRRAHIEGTSRHVFYKLFFSIENVLRRLWPYNINATDVIVMNAVCINNKNNKKRKFHMSHE